MFYIHHRRRTIIAVIFACLSFAFFSHSASARVGQVSTWMGKLYSGDGLDANSANLDMPRGFTLDASCNIYIADTQNHVIRKITNANNEISTFAGNGQYGLSNGAVKNATFRLPSDVVFGPSGEMYVADSDATVVRRIANGVVRDWIPGLKKPSGLVMNGNKIYISDTGANRILIGTTAGSKTNLVASGIVAPGKLAISGTTLFFLYNNGKAFGSIDLNTGTFTALKTNFVNADGLEVHNGIVYAVSGLHGVLNEIVTYNPSDGVFATIKSVYETEWYNHASDITFCGSSMRLLFSGGSSIFKADEDGSNEVKMAGVHRWNDNDGVRSAARVGRPFLLTLSSNKLKMFMFTNQHLKQFDVLQNKLSTITGGQADNYVDGSATDARVSGPMQMVLSPNGMKIYIADRNNNRIRIYDRLTKTMSTLVGSGEFNAFAGTKNAYAEGTPCLGNTAKGVTGCAYFDRPMGLAISKDGKTLYVADSDNNRIRTVNASTGQTALLAGTGTAGMKNGAMKQATFNRPVSLLLSPDGKTLYVVEWGNHAIRSINLVSKRVDTLVGNGKAGYLDGKLKNGRLSLPNYLAQGPGKILYLSEGGSLRIRTLNLSTGTISTLAGSGKKGSLNGAPNVATFSNPRQLVVLNSSTLLVADDSNDMIRAISLK